MLEELAFRAISTVGGGEVCGIGAVARREGNSLVCGGFISHPIEN